MLDSLRKSIKSKLTAPHRWFYAFILAALLDVIDAGEYLVRAAASLAHNWETKSAIAATLALVLDHVYAHLTGVYGTVILAYFWIIVLDILTKWLAIGYRYLTDRGMPAHMITTIDKAQAIWLAFDARQLTSRVMLGGFLGKFVLFGIGTAAAVKLDEIFTALSIPLPLTVLTFVLGYFCYHEALSIAENLRDAGNAHMDKLVELLNTNIFNKLRR